MSQDEKPSVDRMDDPRVPDIQPWAKVMASALIPLIVAAVLPQSARIPLAGASVALFVVGLIMLFKAGLFD